MENTDHPARGIPASSGRQALSRLRTTLLTCTLLAIAGIGGTTAAGVVSKPSFDCARASTDAERTICREPALAVGDAAIARSYRRALAALDPSAAEGLRKDQRAFVAVRDEVLAGGRIMEGDAPAPRKAIDDAVSLQRDRLDFLDAIDAKPDSGMAGEWRNLTGAVTIATAANGVLAVSIYAAEPLQARWVCDVSGNGVAMDGRLILPPDDGNGNRAGLELRRTGAALEVEETPGKDGELTLGNCGLNGSVAGTYFRVPLKRAPTGS